MRILIVEDDALTRELLRHILSSTENELLMAENGAEALDIAHQKQPDIVLTDWMLPKLDGLELCRRLRSVDPGQPYTYIVLLTARDRKEDILSGLEAGADDYIVKPFDRDELMARVQVGERIVRLETVLRHRNAELEESLRTISRLKSLLPICMFCKRIRTDENYWQQIEAYIHEQTGTDFSHGVCPECFEKQYPQYYRRVHERQQGEKPE